jgi:hypothetical protein
LPETVAGEAQPALGDVLTSRARRLADVLLDFTAASEEDDTLALLFMCVHPALTQASSIALTLRAVGGLMTAEIAKAFLAPEATLAQRISRAKLTIKSPVSGSDSLPDEQPEAVRSVLRRLPDLQRGTRAAAGRLGSTLTRPSVSQTRVRSAAGRRGGGRATRIDAADRCPR